MIRRPPRSTQSRSSAASDVYKRQRIAHPPGQTSSPKKDHGGPKASAHYAPPLSGMPTSWHQWSRQYAILDWSRLPANHSTNRRESAEFGDTHPGRQPIRLIPLFSSLRGTSDASSNQAEWFGHPFPEPLKELNNGIRRIGCLPG